jgi:hypothetical protein
MFVFFLKFTQEPNFAYKMKQILLFSFLLLTVHLNAQSSYTIFKNGAEYQSQLVHHSYLVELEANSYQSLLQDQPTNFELEIPVSSSLSFKVILEENNIFADDFVATSKSAGQDQPFNYQKGLYYKGKIAGDPSSLEHVWNNNYYFSQNSQLL